MARPLPPPRLTKPPAALINRGRGSFLANLLLAVSSHCGYYARLTCAREERCNAPVFLFRPMVALPPFPCKSFYTPQQVVAFRRCGAKVQRWLNCMHEKSEKKSCLIIEVPRVRSRESVGIAGFPLVWLPFPPTLRGFHFSRGKVTFKEGLRRGWYEGDMCWERDYYCERFFVGETFPSVYLVFFFFV